MNREEEVVQQAVKEFPRFAERRVGFITGAKWADKTMIEKVCKWIVDNLYGYIEESQKYSGGYSVNLNSLINDFHKAMEE